MDHPATATFDLTLNGLGASRNLLTLAFEPPFLAATLCFCHGAVCRRMAQLQPLRPGPARPSARFRSARPCWCATRAGLIRRAGRHAARCRALCRCLARTAGSWRWVCRVAVRLKETEAAIDRMQERQGDDAGSRYSELAAQLRAARSSADVVQRAVALQQC